MREKLIPPDLKRCQAEKLDGSFMTFGPRPITRCQNKPVLDGKGVIEKKPEMDVASARLCPNEDGWIHGWNACCDAHLLQGYRRVPSVEEIESIIRQYIRFIVEAVGKPNVNITELAVAIHALCEGRKE